MPPSAKRISRIAWPPSPEALGSQTANAQPAATAASTALPPFRRMSIAASVAFGNAVATASAGGADGLDSNEPGWFISID
jgi:hypothetical protein